MADILLITSCLLSASLGFLALGFAVFNMVELRAMKQSTHTIQYVPADQLPGGEKLDDDASLESIRINQGIPINEPDPFEAL